MKKQSRLGIFTTTLGFWFLLATSRAWAAPADLPPLDRILASRCSTALCTQRDGWGAVGFELFADIPMGGAWFVWGKDVHRVSGLEAKRQIRGQFQQSLLSLQGGGRFFGLKGLVSLGFGIAAYKASTITLERRNTGEAFAIGSGAVTASPVLYLGLAEDSIAATFMGVRYVNDGPRQVFADGEIVGRGDVLAKGYVLTLGVAPVALFRAGIGLREE